MPLNIYANQQRPTAEMSAVTAEVAATNPAALVSDDEAKARIDACNATNRKPWIVGRATRDNSHRVNQ